MRFSLYLSPEERSSGRLTEARPQRWLYLDLVEPAFGVLNFAESLPSEVPARERMSERSGLALPLGTEKRRSAGLHDASYADVTAAAGTGAAFAAIDSPLMLEIAELTVGLDVIAQR